MLQAMLIQYIVQLKINIPYTICLAAEVKALEKLGTSKSNRIKAKNRIKIKYLRKRERELHVLKSLNTTANLQLKLIQQVEKRLRKIMLHFNL